MNTRNLPKPITKIPLTLEEMGSVGRGEKRERREEKGVEKKRRPKEKGVAVALCRREEEK
ncbi:hypothetical protein OIU74_018175, partial [Salix koriyanagi]